MPDVCTRRIFRFIGAETQMAWAMQTKHNTYTRHHLHLVSSKVTKGVSIEALASDLDQLAKAKLPDGCLHGILKGQEPEIRQDGVLLALRWYGKCTSKDDWVPAASIAHALRYTKLRYARRLSKRSDHLQMNEELTSANLIFESLDTLPLSGRPHATHMAIEAIHQATQRGRISTSNAAIVLMILEDGQTVSALAKRLRLTKGAVYHHLNQVRAILPSIVDNIEEPQYALKMQLP